MKVAKHYNILMHADFTEKKKQLSFHCIRDENINFFIEA